ncbi:MAG: SDR family oxidoreductase [Alphaproteobacteria bacterium]|nr:SDR family oxidoreductase [Alphaproteobacteria bacterium]
MTARFSGQTAIVTGGARGIGLAIAQRLADEGCRIVVWDRDLAPARQGGFQPALAQRVDVTSLASIEAAFAEAVAAYGQVQVLVNNAGVNGPVLPAWEYPPDAWDRVLAVDLTGVFYCCRAVVPHMRDKAYGRIVTIASIAGKEGMPGITAYSAAKAGVIGYSKALARELATSGVTVNCIAPAITETELFQEMTEAHIASAKARIPMGRFCKVDEIAAQVAYVASPECSFTTGFVFDVTGGRATY